MLRYKPLYLLICALALLSGLSVTAYGPLLQAELADKHIYFAEENGEMSRFDRSPTGLSRYAGLLNLAGAELFTLEWRKGIPADADLIVIPGAITDLTPEQSARLWTYLSKGGRLLLLVDALDENRNTTNRAFPALRGFFELTWSDLGVRARDDVLLRADGPIEPPADSEGEEAEAQADNPTEDQLAAVTLEFMGAAADDHAITTGLTGDLAFRMARSIEVDAALSNAVVTPLIFGPADFYGETSYNDFSGDGILEYNIGSDTGYENHVLAVAVEDTQSRLRMVLVSSGNVARNGRGMVTSPIYSGAFVYPDNAQFLLNVTAWLLDSAAPDIEFATPAATATPTITPTITPTPTSTPTPTADAGA